jgi:hypothetical protein
VVFVLFFVFCLLFVGRIMDGWKDRCLVSCFSCIFSLAFCQPLFVCLAMEEGSNTTNCDELNVLSNVIPFFLSPCSLSCLPVSVILVFYFFV